MPQPRPKVGYNLAYTNLTLRGLSLYTVGQLDLDCIQKLAAEAIDAPAGGGPTLGGSTPLELRWGETFFVDPKLEKGAIMPGQRIARLLSLSALVACAAFLIATQPAAACSSGRCTCPDGSVREPCFCDSYCPCPNAVFSPTGSQRALITISNFSTLEMLEGDFCPVALSGVPGIRSVNDVWMVDQDTGAPIQALDYAVSAAAGVGYEELASEAGIVSGETLPWHGFSARVSRSVPNGTNVDFVLDVTLEDGVSVFELAESLAQKGVWATGSGFSDGTPNGHHFGFRPFGGDVLVWTGLPEVVPPEQEPTTLLKRP